MSKLIQEAALWPGETTYFQEPHCEAPFTAAVHEVVGAGNGMVDKPFLFSVKGRIV